METGNDCTINQNKSDEERGRSDETQKLQNTEMTTGTPTPKLLKKLESLKTQWKQDHEISTQQDWEIGSVESSLGRTTLSSHETSALVRTPKNSDVFDRLYRNERRYRKAKRRDSPETLSDDDKQRSIPTSPASSSLGSFNSASLERKLGYRPPGEVRRVRQQQRAESSSSHQSVKTDSTSIFERLYRKEPRNTALKRTPIRSGSSVRQPSRNTPITPSRSAHSLSSAPRLQTSINSVHDRLYRQRKMTPTIAAKIEASLSPSTRSTHSAASESKNSQSVFERLYRGEPRSTPVLQKKPGVTPNTGGKLRNQLMKSSNTPSITSSVITPSATLTTTSLTAESCSPGSDVLIQTQSASQDSINRRMKSKIPTPTATTPRLATFRTPSTALKPDKNSKAVTRNNRLERMSKSLAIDTSNTDDDQMKKKTDQINSPETFPATSSSIGSGSTAFTTTTPTSRTTVTTCMTAPRVSDESVMFTEHAARKIQSYFRGSRIRDKHGVSAQSERCLFDSSPSNFDEAGALVIQCFWRMQRERRKIRKARKFAIWTQATWRMRVERINYTNKCACDRLKEAEAAIRIQNAFRSVRERRRKKLESSAQRLLDAAFEFGKIKAARLIQKWWLQRIRIFHRLESKRRRILHNALLERSATLIQSVWRGFINRFAYQEAREAATAAKIDSLRGLRILRDRKDFEENAHRLQENYVRYMLQEGRKTAARRIKNVWHVLLLRIAYEEVLSSSILLQAVVRGWLARLRSKRIYCAATILQSLGRSFVERKRFLLLVSQKTKDDQNAHVTRIQTKWRSRLERNLFVRVKRSIIWSQRTWRKILEERAQEGNRLNLQQLAQTGAVDTPTLDCAGEEMFCEGLNGTLMGQENFRYAGIGNPIIHSIVEEVEKEAEKHTAFLLGKDTGAAFKGPFDAPCLLRLALRTKATQALYMAQGGFR